MRITQMVNLPIEYSSRKVTPFGEMCLMKDLIDQLGITHLLGSQLYHWIPFL
jgi:hypothetical protein